MAVAGIVGKAWGRQRPHAFLWTPVAFGLGVALYFARLTELAGWEWLAVAAAAALGGLAWRRGWRVGAAVLLVAAGLGAAEWRSRTVAAPILEYRFYGPVTGTIVAVDRARSDRPRITLRDVWLKDRPAPARVRITLHGSVHAPLQPGQTVMLTAHLSPPGGPVEPGGFDFRRLAWFAQLGAVGYTTSALLRSPDPPAQGPGLWLAQLRRTIAEGVRDRMGGERGAVAAAILVGDRSAIPVPVLEDLRATNLAHLLAISGLHMGLMTGLVFGGMRLALAAWPAAALRLPGKKVAALGALAAGAVYLALAGATIPTQRAFIMAAVVFGAMLLDRPAFTLRAVALAALIVLAIRPEALLSAGFQLSFAATTALVAAFGAVSARAGARGWLISLVVSSLVADAATAPFGAFHFNIMAPYGVPANLIAVPIMGSVVMPGAALAALGWPLGLEAPGLWIMGLGLDWILAIAEGFAALDGAVIRVPSPGASVLVVLSLGGLWLCLWQGHGRWLAALPLALSGLMWWGAERPPVLVSASGTLVGVLGPEGRALSKPRGDGFAAGTWLENDGDAADQEAAAARWDGAPGLAAVRLDRSRDPPDDLAAACAGLDVLIAPRWEVAPPCLALTQPVLRASGGGAVYPGPRLVPAIPWDEARRWTNR